MHINLIDDLKRINFIFKNKEIYTECVKFCEVITILGRKFGPFEKGKKYWLKFFLAIPFIENNILKITSSDKCDNVDVQRYAIAERDNQKLIQQENEYFLNKIRDFQAFLEMEILDGVRPKIDSDRFNSYLSNIIDSRLLKLLRMSRTELSLEDEKKLTSSEKLFFDIIYEYIKTWRSFYLKRNKSKNH